MYFKNMISIVNERNIIHFFFKIFACKTFLKSIVIVEYHVVWVIISDDDDNDICLKQC